MALMRKRVICSLVIVAIGLLAWFWSGRATVLHWPVAGPPSAPTIEPKLAKRTQLIEPLAAPATATALAVAMARPDLDANLPAVDTPLVTAREAWWSAARAGSGEAAWRLSQALDTCQQYPEIRRQLAGSKADGRDEQRIAMEEFLVLAEPYCAGLPRDLLPDLREAQWLGVQAGDVRAMFDYVLNPAIPAGQSIALAEHWQRYREHAPQLARHLLAQGYADMAYHLALAHDAQIRRLAPSLPQSGRDELGFDGQPRRLEESLGQALPDDAAMAWRYARLCTKVAAPSFTEQCADIERANAARLTAQQRESLDEWVQEQRKSLRLQPAPKRIGFTMYGL